MICKGGDKVGPATNYWKFDENSYTVYECLNEDACLGAVTDANSGCNSIEIIVF